MQTPVRITLVLWATILLGACTTLLGACTTPTPSLERLYRTAESSADHPPVILIHGAFGSRLCDEDGDEHWPGSLSDILFASYKQLALHVADEPNANPVLTPCGLTDTVAGQDFYGSIEKTLTGPGGYVRTLAGTAVAPGQRRYYRFTYDWRNDNAANAAAFDGFVEQIRSDHGNPDLQVDIVAHSMGGLLTRYWLRYGASDVLNSNDFPLNNSGGNKVRRVILVGTPNLGSTSALQQILTGADFGVNSIDSEVLLTFPSAYQLLPHPISDAVLNNNGRPLKRDIFDISIWRALRWGPFDPALRQRLRSSGWSGQDLASLERYTHKHLERARRFVWSLTVANEQRPYELVVFGGDCSPSPARIVIEDTAEDSFVRLWPREIENPRPGLNYEELMLEPGDGAVTKASLLARTALDPSVPRHRYSDFPLDYAVMFCEAHSMLPGNITFQDNLLHILLSR